MLTDLLKNRIHFLPAPLWFLYDDRLPGFFSLCRMENELSDLFCRKVDLRTPQELSRYFRDEVLRTAEVQYES
jgi:hypothetical protein